MAETRPKDPTRVLIQYIGNHELSKQRPHGNSKKANSVYVRIQPSILDYLKKSVSTSTAKPHQIYKNIITKETITKDPESDRPTTSNITVTNEETPTNIIQDDTLKPPECVDHDSPKLIENPAHPAVSLPRNVDQIKNIKMWMSNQPPIQVKRQRYPTSHLLISGF